MNTASKIVTILYILLLSSCNASPPLTFTTASSHPSTNTPITASLTPTPSKVAITATTSPTATAVPTWKHESLCSAVKQQLSSDKILPGSLILSDKRNLYAFDFATKVASPLRASPGAIVGQYNEDFKPSPNSTWMAYIESFSDNSNSLIKRHLRLINASLQPHQLSNWDIDWQWIIGWIDNENLALWVPDQIDGTVIVYNPFTGQSRTLSPEFPVSAEEYFSSSWYLWGQPLPYYNSDLTKVVYPDNSSRVILWDVNKNQELWSGTTREFSNSSNAVWSQDNKKLIITTANNDGEDFVYFLFEDNHVEITQIPLYPFRNIELFSMSPDGRYISVWASKDIFSTPELLLIDLDELNVVDLCINVDFMISPVWSHDSKYFGVSGYTEAGSETVIYSVEDYRSYKVPLKDLNMVAWLGE